MNSASLHCDHATHPRRGESDSAIGLLLRLAFGEEVTSAEALRLLHSTPDRDELQRLERAARIKARDAALREAAQALGGDSPGAWVLAGRLADAIERFEYRMWPRLVAGVDLELSPSETAIYRAFLAGDRVPKTARWLYELLK